MPDDVGDAIGSAPKSGRPKWTALAEAFKSGKITSTAALAILGRFDPATSSDERLELLLKDIARRGARPGQGRKVTPLDGVTITSGRGGIAVSIKRAGRTAAFADWLETRLEEMIKDSYETFTAVNSKEDT